jgi:hypothetical protein
LRPLAACLIGWTRFFDEGHRQVGPFGLVVFIGLLLLGAGLVGYRFRPLIGEMGANVVAVDVLDLTAGRQRWLPPDGRRVGAGQEELVAARRRQARRCTRGRAPDAKRDRCWGRWRCRRGNRQCGLRVVFFERQIIGIFGNYTSDRR